jgi:hypothetical protein
MSLADELAETRGPSKTDLWMADWYSELDDADKATFDAWVANPRKTVSRMFRAVERRGYPCGLEAFRRWAHKQHRDAS